MRRSVVHEGIDYLVADDDPLPYDARWWAVLRTRAVDELTGEPPLNRVTIRTTTPGCLPRVAERGLCGLVARPRMVSAQLLAPGRLDAEIHAEGYLPRSLTAAIDAARRSTNATAIGDGLVTIAPPEPTGRPQFRPGRGVMLETRTVNQAHEFTLHGDPAVAPALNEVPLVDPVRETRAAAGAPWRVAGVPIVLPDQPLHRAQPALVRGRALRQPAAGAALEPAPLTRIGLTGVWWFNSEIAATLAPPHAANLVAFAAPLAFDHPQPALLERLASRTPDGVLRAFAAGAPAGATEIELTAVTSLNAAGGDILELEAASSAERELVITAGYAAPIGTARATVRLATPLAFAHRAGTPVEGVALTFAALGNLERDAQRGDRVLFADTLTGVGSEDVLLIAAGTPAAELRFVRRFPAYDSATNTFSHPPVFDDDGSFTLPPIARVAQMQLFVEHTGQAVHPTIDLVPDYRGDTTLQILFKP